MALHRRLSRHFCTLRAPFFFHSRTCSTDFPVVLFLACHIRNSIDAGCMCIQCASLPPDMTIVAAVEVDCSAGISGTSPHTYATSNQFSQMNPMNSIMVKLSLCEVKSHFHRSQMFRLNQISSMFSERTAYLAIINSLDEIGFLASFRSREWSEWVVRLIFGAITIYSRFVMSWRWDIYDRLHRKKKTNDIFYGCTDFNLVGMCSSQSMCI